MIYKFSDGTIDVYPNVAPRHMDLMTRIRKNPHIEEAVACYAEYLLAKYENGNKRLRLTGGGT